MKEKKLVVVLAAKSKQKRSWSWADGQEFCITQKNLRSGGGKAN